MWLQKLANNKEPSKALVFGDMGGAQKSSKTFQALSLITKKSLYKS